MALPLPSPAPLARTVDPVQKYDMPDYLKRGSRVVERAQVQQAVVDRPELICELICDRGLRPSNALLCKVGAKDTPSLPHQPLNAQQVRLLLPATVLKQTPHLHTRKIHSVSRSSSPTRSSAAPDPPLLFGPSPTQIDLSANSKHLLRSLQVNTSWAV